MGFVHAFAEFISERLRRRGLTRMAFARRVERSDGNLSNILNADPARKTQYRPPLDEMDMWAEVLGLDPAEREQLVELAELAHTPPAIRERYLAMKVMLARPAQQAASPAEPYGEGPDMSALRELERIRNPDEHARPPTPTYPRPTPVRRGTHDRE